MPYHQVLPNKTIRAPNGGTFTAKGVTLFDFLFITWEPRSNYDFRSFLNPAWAYPTTPGVSEPTYAARYLYKSPAYAAAQIQQAWALGVNLIRIAVEPAVMFATLSYVDPVDGNTYPSDPAMLDDIIAAAAALGVVVQLQMCQDYCPPALVPPFMTWLAERYGACSNVWINPWNEPNGMPPATNSNNVAAWSAKVPPCVIALREAGWAAPIAIDPPGWATRIDLIGPILQAAPFVNDPNLIINIHEYPVYGDVDFITSRLPTLQSQWVAYLPYYCVMIGECGWDANNYTTGQYGLISCFSAFLSWANAQIAAGSLKGLIGEPGVLYYPNSTAPAGYSTYMLTAVNDFVNNFLSPPAGITVSTGSNIGTFSPVANPIPVADGTNGQPPLQAFGLSGQCSAAMFISNGGPLVGFHNSATGASLGCIIQTGGGVSIYSPSDARLKDRIEDADSDAAIAALSALHAVSAVWKSASGLPELMFLAHELQAVIPSAVIGEKDAIDKEGNAIYQMADYAKLIPLIVAAMQALILRIEKLQGLSS